MHPCDGSNQQLTWAQPVIGTCHACQDALSRWARGGPHLCCRACEVRAVAESPMDTRQASYARLVADAGALT